MMNSTERAELYRQGHTHGWHELDLENGLKPEDSEQRLFVVYNSGNGSHTIVATTFRQTLMDMASGKLVNVSDGYDYWKPYDGNLRPLPGEQVFCNPPTVVVVLVPVVSGLLLVRRATGDTHGKLALPGGFQEVSDETWQEAGAREVFEETGVVIDPTRLVHLETRTVEDGKVNLLFCLYPSRLPDPTPREKNKEILEVLTTKGPVETAFETHTRHVKQFFE